MFPQNVPIPKQVLSQLVKVVPPWRDLIKDDYAFVWSENQEKTINLANNLTAILSGS